MRKSKNEVKYYRICGIIELVLSIALMCLFIFLIITNDASKSSDLLHASLVFTFVFGFLTFVTSIWLISYKPEDEKDVNKETDNSNTVSKTKD